MDPVQPRISLIYTTINEKNLVRRCARKKVFKSTFRVSSQISTDLRIYKYIFDFSLAALRCVLLRMICCCHAILRSVLSVVIVRLILGEHYR